MDTHALMAWTAWAIHEAESASPAKEFKPNDVDESLLNRVAKLSAADSGPLDARDFLGRHGIALVTAEHLPKTYLDGALIYGSFPIIALTLRHDRLDSFWFTLLHELAHLLQACRHRALSPSSMISRWSRETNSSSKPTPSLGRPWCPSLTGSRALQASCVHPRLCCTLRLGLVCTLRSLPVASGMTRATIAS